MLKHSSPLIFISGVFGNYTGAHEIFQMLRFQHQILPFQSIKVLKISSYKNVQQFNCLFEMVHKAKLRKELGSFEFLNIKSFNYELIDLFINTPPNRKLVVIHVEITFVTQNDEITFVNVNTDPLEVIRQIEPQKIHEEIPIIDPSAHKIILTLQEYLLIPLTPMEIQCLAFALCGFSSKQIGSHLHLSHRTIETYLQNAYFKLGSKGKGECLEMMYENNLIHDFQKLCYLLMQHPEAVCRSSNYAYYA